MYDASAGFTNPAKRLIVLSLRVAIIESATDALVHGSQWRAFFGSYPEPWNFGGVIETLLHEFIHMRLRGLRHCPRFWRELREAKKRLTALPLGKCIASTTSEVASDDAVCAA
jgi:hypothetical protein